MEYRKMLEHRKTEMESRYSNVAGEWGRVSRELLVIRKSSDKNAHESFPNALFSSEGRMNVVH